MAARKKPEAFVEDGAVYVTRSGPPIYIKTADVCAMTGKSAQWIGQLVSQGTLSKRSTKHGAFFDAAATMRAYCDMLEARAKEPEDEVITAAERDKTDAEVRIKKSKAVMMELEAKELQGKMHRSEDVAAMTEDLIYTIRGALMALPGRVAVDVASTPAEASEIIRKEVNRVMKDIANYRYDPEKYEKLVRGRMQWDANGGHLKDDD